MQAYRNDAGQIVYAENVDGSVNLSSVNFPDGTVQATTATALPASGPPVLINNSSDAVRAVPVSSTDASGSFFASVNITGATWANGIAVFTTSQNPNYLSVDDLITVQGVNPSGYNVTARATSVTVNSFSVPMANDPGAWISNGFTSTQPEVYIAPRSALVPAMGIVCHAQSVPAGHDVFPPVFYIAGGDALYTNYSWGVGCDGHSVSIYVVGHRKAFENGIVHQWTSEHNVGWTSSPTIDPVNSASLDTNVSRTAAGAVAIGTGAQGSAAGTIQAATHQCGTSGPTWTSGTGAPSGAPAGGKGSMFSRTDGSAGSVLYVWNGASWTAVA